MFQRGATTHWYNRVSNNWLIHASNAEFSEDACEQDNNI